MSRERTPETRVAILPDGRRLTARLWPGAGEPIVLLHGLLATGAAWDPLCEAQSRPCVAVDLPGFGGSERGTRPRISAFAQDVQAVLDLLDLESFALVGHSLGGAVATALAESVAGRVSSLLLLAPAGFGRIALAELVALPGVRSVAERGLPTVLSRRLPLSLAYRAVVANGLAPEPAEIARVLERGGDLAAPVRDATLAVAAAGTSREAFHRRRVDYDGRVTALWGSRDRLVPCTHRCGVPTAFPHADVLLWRGMGHHPLRERPGDLLQLVGEVCTPLAIGARRRVARARPVPQTRLALRPAA